MKKKSKLQTEIDKDITTMIKNDGELQILDEECRKETRRIKNNLKNLNIYQQMAFGELFQFWMDAIFELYDLYKLGLDPSNKATEVIKQCMWETIDLSKVI